MWFYNFNSYNNDSFNKWKIHFICTILSIYVFTGYRILPGLQVILNAISSIRKSEKSLNIIYNELYKNNSEQE